MPHAVKDNIVVRKSILERYCVTFAHMAYLLLCLFVVSAVVFSYISKNCPNWIWKREVTLFVELIKDQFIMFFGNNTQLLFQVAGTIAVSVIILSIVSAIIVLNSVYMVLANIFESRLLKKV